jgi:GMP synthase-like glutamine amidotransferase
MITLCVVQHTDGEYLGLLEDHFEGRAIRFVYARPHVPGGSLPAAAQGHDGLVLLGAGPQGMASGDLLPSLAAELRLTSAFLDAGLPVIGIGLGSIMLAVAAGGGCAAAPLRFCVGEASRTDPDALAGHLPPTYPYALYMRDRALLPADARVLAVDEAGAPMLFQVRGNCLGFTAHPGIKSGMIEDLVMEFDAAPENVPEGLAQLAARQRPIAQALSGIMVGLVKVTGLMDTAGARGEV